MQVTRRAVSFGIMAAGLSACTGGGGSTPSRSAAPQLKSAPNAGWDVWVAAFRGRAQAKGISTDTLNAAFRGAGFLPGVIERDRNQTEFTRTLEDYLAIAASDDRIAGGKAELRKQASTLSQIEYIAQPNISRFLGGNVAGAIVCVVILVLLSKGHFFIILVVLLPK